MLRGYFASPDPADPRLTLEVRVIVYCAIRPDVLEKIVATIPVKRLGRPEEIASIVAWIASEESGFSTGADFSLNGGLHMG